MQAVWIFRIISPIVWILNGLCIVVRHPGLWSLIYLANAIGVTAAWVMAEYRLALS